MSLPFISRNRGGAFAAGPGASAGAASTVTRSDALVCHWKFDGDYTDEQGNCDLAAYSGGDPVFSSSEKKFGTHSLDLDGTGDCAVGANGGIDDLASAYTISCWIYPEFYSFLDGILAFTSTSYTAPHANILADSCTMFLDSDAADDVPKTLRYMHKTVAGNYTCNDDSSIVTADAWNFLAMTWDGSNANFWKAKDGDSVVSQPTGGTGSATDVDANIDKVWVGTARTTTFNGFIDDVRYYSAGLSEAELNEVYNGGDGDF